MTTSHPAVRRPWAALLTAAVAAGLILLAASWLPEDTHPRTTSPSYAVQRR